MTAAREREGFEAIKYRALEACRRYAEIDAEIKSIQGQISSLYCLDPVRENDVTASNISLAELVASPSRSCLDRLFDHNRRGRYYAKAPSLCEGCQAIYDAIQRRKHLRQRLGAAKREINRVGRM